MKNSRYDISLIRKYLNGELDGSAMYKLEREAQNDPLLMDLLSGMESGNEQEHQQAISEIDLLIDQKTSNNRNQKTISWTTIGMAASFLIATSIAAFLVLQDKPTPKVVKRESEIPTGRKHTPSSTDSIASIAKAPEQTATISKKQRQAIQRSNEVLAPNDEEILIASSPNAMDTLTRAEISEVVVVGYGTQKKMAITGSVTQTDSNKIEQTLQGRVAGVQIASKRAKAKKVEKGPVTISGVITDKQDKSPLPGVYVKIKGEEQGTTTDSDGRFTITLPGKEKTLEVIYIGYQKQLVKVDKGSPLEIALEPQLIALNEVVVVGYGVQSANTDEVPTEAQPADGWANFRKYLKENVRSLLKEDRGAVVMSFSVTPQGSISDAKIIKGVNEVVNKKAVDLLLNGPKWIGAKDGTTKEIRIRIRFY